jgi:hypothetical protein
MQGRITWRLGGEENDSLTGVLVGVLLVGRDTRFLCADEH